MEIVVVVVVHHDTIVPYTVKQHSTAMDEIGIVLTNDDWFCNQMNLRLGEIVVVVVVDDYFGNWFDHSKALNYN
jgi:extradiol dioxygenase family protein